MRGDTRTTYDCYRATINGRTYKTEFRYQDIKRVSETFKNVSWTLVNAWEVRV